MYIQPQAEQPMQLPRDYSGSAFSQNEAPPVEAISPETGEENREFREEAAPESAESVEAGAFSHRGPPPQETHGQRKPSDPPPRGGFFGKFPLLSALLPPPRGKDKHGTGLLDGDLKEWLLIGVALLLLLRDQGDDILPLLLLLLLWE